MLEIHILFIVYSYTAYSQVFVYLLYRYSQLREAAQMLKTVEPELLKCEGYKRSLAAEQVWTQRKTVKTNFEIQLDSDSTSLVFTQTINF